MTASTHSVTQAVELEMIRTDSEFYRQLLTEVVGNHKLGILPFGLTPYLSFFVVETYNYFSSRAPGFANAARRQHEGILRASRTRTKLFDDDEKDIALLMDHLEWILTFSRSWMNSDHIGPLAWLKKWLQPDMGLYFYEGHLISTTQAAFFNLGFEKGDIATTQRGEPIGLSQLSQSIGYDIGQYIGFLSGGSMGTSSGGSTATLCRYQLADSQFRHEDKKSRAYLRGIYNGRATTQINACLLLFLTTTNFLTHVFGRLVIDSPDTWFKVKFLAVYHVISSLTKLQNHFYTTGQLSERSKNYLKSLLGDRELKTLKSKSSFRNIMAHYTIKDVPEGSLKPDVRYFGLIEHFFAGSGLKEVNDMVDRQLLRISSVLEGWQSPVSRSNPSF